MKFYAFRQQPQFYNGINTAYCSPCNLNCLYCYSQNKRDTGKEHTPQEVANKLLKLSTKEPHKHTNCRVSGGELTTNKEFTMELIETLMDETNLTFLLETNGIQIGRDTDFQERLKEFAPYSDEGRFAARVSVKHVDPKAFRAITGAHAPEIYEAPFLAIKALAEMGVDVMVAYMDDFYGNKDLESLFQFMGDLGLMPDESEYNNDDEFLDAAIHLDPEEFTRYKSVPLGKGEIQKRIIEAL
jgi:uncharacterized Fe-S cluster-containing radical SAM superfamily protein